MEAATANRARDKYKANCHNAKTLEQYNKQSAKLREDCDKKLKALKELHRQGKAQKTIGQRESKLRAAKQIVHKRESQLDRKEANLDKKVKHHAQAVLKHKLQGAVNGKSCKDTQHGSHHKLSPQAIEHSINKGIKNNKVKCACSHKNVGNNGLSQMDEDNNCDCDDDEMEDGGMP